MYKSIRFRLTLVLLVLCCTVGCDQMSKHMARTVLVSHRVDTMSGGLFELTLAENPGAFLSLGESLPTAARSLISIGMGIGIALLMVQLVRGSNFPRLHFFGLLLASAGGVSNLVDRFARHGFVTDFMVIRWGALHTGIFNLADVVIMGGLVILGLSALTKRHKKENGPHDFKDQKR
jgi:signal peptidase II